MIIITNISIIVFTIIIIIHLATCVVSRTVGSRDDAEDDAADQVLPHHGDDPQQVGSGDARLGAVVRRARRTRFCRCPQRKDTVTVLTFERQERQTVSINDDVQLVGETPKPGLQPCCWCSDMFERENPDSSMFWWCNFANVCERPKVDLVPIGG